MSQQGTSGILEMLSATEWQFGLQKDVEFSKMFTLTKIIGIAFATIGDRGPTISH